MEPKRALIVSIVAASLAVAIVAVDLQVGVELELDQMIDGEWQTVASSDGGYPRYEMFRPGCAGPDLRVIVQNDLPWTITETLVVTTNTYQPGSSTLLREEITLERGAYEIREFTVPEPDAMNQTGSPEIRFTSQTVNVQFGDLWLSTCVEVA